MTKAKDTGNPAQWVGAIAALILGGLLIYSIVTKNPVSGPHFSDGTWTEGTTIGSSEAANKLVEYSDYFCSFCADFQEAVNDDRFKKDYLDSKKVQLETRIVTVLKEISPNTEQGADAAMCATEQNKFYDYSNHIVPRIKTDFFDKGIGVKNVANPKSIDKLPASYFTTSAEAVGLDVPKFESCMSSQKYAEDIAKITEKAMQLGVVGLPYIVANDYVANGMSGGYDGLTYILKAGGIK